MQHQTMKPMPVFRVVRAAWWFRPMALLLCINMTGCNGCLTMKPVVEDAPVPQESLTLEQVNQLVKEKIKENEEQLRQDGKLDESGGEPKVKIENLPAEEVVAAAEIDSYEKFTELFKSKTGQEWENFKGRFKGAVDGANTEPPALPDASEFESKLKEFEEDDTKDEKQKKALKTFNDALEEFQQKAEIARTKIGELQTKTREVFDSVQEVIDQVEQLKSNPSNGEEIAQRLVDEAVPGMLEKFESLHGEEFEKLARETHEAQAAAREALEALKKAKDVLVALDFLSDETEEDLNNFEQDVDDFVKKTEEITEAMSQAAELSQAVVAAFAVNPYLGIAVLAIIAILAIFGGFGGGGGSGKGGDSEGEDGEGDSQEGSSKSSTGDEDSDKEGGQKVQGDKNVKQNPGPPPEANASNLDGAESNIGSTAESSENGPWFRTKWNGDVLTFQLIFKKTDGSAHEEFLELKRKEGDEDHNRAMDQFIQAREGQRNVNVESVSASDFSFPYSVVVTGIDPGQITITWRDKTEPPEIKGL